MAGLSTGLKKKLKISECEMKDGKIELKSGGKEFDVMLNPSNYSHERSICYNQKKTQGQPAAETKFSAVGAEKVGFDLVLDGTGVVNLTTPDVKMQVENLEKVVYKYDGQKHEPNPVRLLWGSLIFFGRLESMSVEYTLFKPSGEPLRAKIKAAFTGAMSKEEKALRANQSSPDLTHIVEVKAGDTLPLLCYRIYRDSSYYPEVAKANNIVNFRHLTPGSQLQFPPLR